MPSQNPKLRTDLIFRLQQGAEGAHYVIKDPQSGQFLRLGEVEASVVRQLDGGADAEAIAARVAKAFGGELSAETVERFVARLRQLGLLEEPASAASPRRSARRLRGDPLYASFAVFDPDRLLDRLHARLSWLFTPSVLGSCPVLIALAAGVALSNRAEVARELQTVLSRFDSLVGFWFAVLAVGVLHEFAHGLTCQHFGGQVPEMGVMLIYLNPALYCNVSDAWLFPERAQRLWVTFAGAFAEVTIWALATLFWWASNPQTGLHAVALIVATTSAAKTFFNLNPLIKLDGYYLLSDWLQIPNLRSRAFAYLGARVRGLWSGSAALAPAPTARERRIFLLYGAVSFVFTYWLFGATLRWIGGELIDRYQLWGLVLLIGVLMPMFRSGLGRLWSALARRLGLSALSGDPGLSERAHRRRRRVLVAASGFAVLVAAFGQMELHVGGEFLVRPEHNADVRAQVDGLIAKVHVREGERVERGAQIASLADYDIRSELEQTLASVREKSARLQMLRVGKTTGQVFGTWLAG